VIGLTHFRICAEGRKPALDRAENAGRVGLAKSSAGGAGDGIKAAIAIFIVY
jgi:hypothetical protein